MSASPVTRQAVESKSIPIKKMLIKDPSELPSHYSSTPGGTLFSTTPGGTKIVYEKSFLMTLRNSPISKTPPNFDIPEHLLPGSGSPSKNNDKYHGGSHKPRYQHKPSTKTNTKKIEIIRQKVNEVNEDQFQIDL